MASSRRSGSRPSAATAAGAPASCSTDRQTAVLTKKTESVSGARSLLAMGPPAARLPFPPPEAGGKILAGGSMTESSTVSVASSMAPAHLSQRASAAAKAACSSFVLRPGSRSMAQQQAHTSAKASETSARRRKASALLLGACTPALLLDRCCCCACWASVGRSRRSAYLAATRSRLSSTVLW